MDSYDAETLEELFRTYRTGGRCPMNYRTQRPPIWHEYYGPKELRHTDHDDIMDALHYATDTVKGRVPSSTPDVEDLPDWRSMLDE